MITYMELYSRAVMADRNPEAEAARRATEATRATLGPAAGRDGRCYPTCRTRRFQSHVSVPVTAHDGEYRQGPRDELSRSRE